MKDHFYSNKHDVSNPSLLIKTHLIPSKNHRKLAPNPIIVKNLQGKGFN